VTEVEAYAGESDPASHAYRGPSGRNEVMYGPAGYLYVYFVYGMHWCANIVTGIDGTASAVLLRAGEVVDGVEVARSRRGARSRSTSRAVPDRDLARGPARLASCLGLTGANTGDLADLTPPPRRPAIGVASGPRVGIAQAADLPWRFWIDGDPTVSAFRRWTPRRRSSGVAAVVSAKLE